MNPVERVKQALAAVGLDADLVRELPADTSTAEAAAEAVAAAAISTAPTNHGATATPRTAPN